MENDYKLVCSRCGGSNIETKAWVDANDDTVLSACSDGETDDNWCRDCEDHVSFIFDYDYKNQQEDDTRVDTEN